MRRLLGGRLVARMIGGASLVAAAASAQVIAIAIAPARAPAATPTSAPASNPPQVRRLTATARPRELQFGHGTVISGTLTAAGGAAPVTSGAATAISGEPLELRASRYPFDRYRDVGHVETRVDGSFSFPAVRPDRNTRFQVVDRGTPAVLSAPVTVLVDAPAVQHVYRLRDGEAMVTVLSYHGRDLNWGGRPVHWFAAPFGSGNFTLVAVTRTRDVRPGVTYMTATFYAPARHFVYRVCFDAPLEQALGPPHPPCPTRSFVLPRRRGNRR